MEFDNATIRELLREDPQLLVRPRARWYPEPDGLRWISREGLERLTYAAQQDAAAAGFPMPHNLWKHGPAVSWPRCRAFRGDPDMVGQYARFAGWLHALVRAQREHPGRIATLRRVIWRCVSPRGVNSPHTRIDLWDLARVGSPEYTSQRLARVRWRAAEILRPWGLNPSWESVAYGAYTARSTGRAAVIAAASNLGHLQAGYRQGYRSAREYLASVRGVSTILRRIPQRWRARCAHEAAAIAAALAGNAEPFLGVWNAEVRARIGAALGGDYVAEIGEVVHQDDWGTLFSLAVDRAGPLLFVRVVNSTPEPDGSYRDFLLLVHHELRPILDDEGTLGAIQELTALNAVASTFGLTGQEYAARLLVQS